LLEVRPRYAYPVTTSPGLKSLQKNLAIQLGERQ